ncbi:MAG TPA: superoxide dismutase family protein [Myxococcales bacterium]|nr:superoxide dismutase family protein [Myxococcales bacterium]
MRLSSLLVILACACATASSPPASSTPAAAPTPAAAAPEPVTPTAVTATLESRSNSSVTGTARVTPGGSGVIVMVDVSGATPGEHGVHIHDKGDCSAPDATSAGPHYNPKASHHGGLSTPVRHTGDLGNMQVDSNGKGLLVVAVPDLTMDQVAGHSVLVHAGKDDLQSDPAGNSGARIACGTLQAAPAQ